VFLEELASTVAKFMASVDAANATAKMLASQTETALKRWLELCKPVAMVDQQTAHGMLDDLAFGRQKLAAFTDEVARCVHATRQIVKFEEDRLPLVDLTGPHTAIIGMLAQLRETLDRLAMLQPNAQVTVGVLLCAIYFLIFFLFAGAGDHVCASGAGRVCTARARDHNVGA
jgi:hypothetical protein